MKLPISNPEATAWYRGINGYQWLVLVLASAGWVFDVYEGQIFNITSKFLLTDVLPEGSSTEDINFYRDVFLGVFLVGGTLGGVVFGALADRWGRRPTLAVTILMYSVCSGLTYFARGPWEVGVLRFLVAVGVGGEWSVGATLVAEVFPARARAQAASIFHSSSILGTWMAGLAGLAVGIHWRYAYLVGVLPALLVFFVYAGIAEPKTWLHARAASSSGSLGELISDARWRKRAVLGLLLAAVGLGTFWSVTVAGQELAKTLLLGQGVAEEEAHRDAVIAYSIVETAGGGLGLLAFGPLSVRWGRRWTFMAFQLAGLAIVPVTCYAPAEYWQLLVLLPFYGFCTLGFHAGYAVYFPELFPTRLRATGAGVCFNGGRLAAASVLLFSAWLKARTDLRLAATLTLLSSLFLLGIVLAWLLPETKDQPLPE